MAFYGQQEKSGAAMRPFIGKLTSQSPCPRAGLVALRQTFVRRCRGGLGSPRAAGNRQIKYDSGEVRAALGADVGRGPMLLIHAAVIRELAGSLGGIDAGTLPPHGFVPVRAEPVDMRTNFCLDLRHS